MCCRIAIAGYASKILKTGGGIIYRLGKKTGFEKERRKEGQCRLNCSLVSSLLRSIQLSWGMMRRACAKRAVADLPRIFNDRGRALEMGF
jgi:hypothetical protein